MQKKEPKRLWKGCGGIVADKRLKWDLTSGEGLLERESVAATVQRRVRGIVR